jgi:hypothetical protein
MTRASIEKDFFAKGMDGRAFASPKGFGPAGGSSPAMTT